MRFAHLAFAVPFAFIVISLSPSKPIAAPRYSGWSEPQNLGPPINSIHNDTAPSLSKDGRSLYFSSNRPCGEGDLVLDLNIWVANRGDADAPWHAPTCIDLNLDGFEDSAAAFSRDGHWMFFVSDRPGSKPGMGSPSAAFNARDLWVSWRAWVHNDNDWTEPVNAGALNSNQADAGPTYFEGDGIGWPQLFFTSSRNGTFDVWQADVFGDGQFGVPSRVIEVSTATDVEARPSIRHDGLEMFFFRIAQGATGGDIFLTTRADTSQPWSEPVNLGAPVNTALNDQQPSISADRETLFLASNRVGTLGNLDIWMATRDKGDKP
jgi:hypothetical protein